MIRRKRRDSKHEPAAHGQRRQSGVPSSTLSSYYAAEHHPLSPSDDDDDDALLPPPVATVVGVEPPPPSGGVGSYRQGRMSEITMPTIATAGFGGGGGGGGGLGGDPPSSSGRRFTTSSVSDIYEGNNPWESPRRDSRSNGVNNNPRLSTASRSSFHGGGGGGPPMTDLHGPKGTSGKDPRRMDSDQCRNLLDEGYSSGLALALAENASRYDFRFWVVDNSGSMQIGDGHRIVRRENGSRNKSKESNRAVACTRWEEIRETVGYHAHMASVLDCPTIFKLLNDPGMRTAPQKFSVCEHGHSYAESEVSRAIDIMRKVSPSGVTPLTQHLWDIEEHISGMADELRRTGKLVAIILATDGLPTDDQGYGGEDITGEFISALRALGGLPVWTVIRLCTDESDVRQFYNSLDSQLEISLEVLDDYMGEAREVYKQNPWITYALPLHRCRELGYHDRLFDLIDERPLTVGEARAFCCLILGLEDEDTLPDPGAEPVAFLKSVKVLLEKERLQWNPMKKKMTPWILTKELKKSFSSNRNCAIM